MGSSNSVRQLDIGADEQDSKRLLFQDMCVCVHKFWLSLLLGSL